MQTDGDVPDTRRTSSGIRARVLYEYRILVSDSFDTQAEAEVAEPKPIDKAWKKATELFTFENGKWTRRETTGPEDPE